MLLVDKLQWIIIDFGMNIKNLIWGCCMQHTLYTSGEHRENDVVKYGGSTTGRQSERLLYIFKTLLSAEQAHKNTDGEKEHKELEGNWRKCVDFEI